MAAPSTEDREKNDGSQFKCHQNYLAWFEWDT